MPQNADVQDQTGADAPESASLINSRFLFVDIAAQRAKQLRRGALPRVERQPGAPHKLERIAMDEVRKGLIEYTLPTPLDGGSRAET